VKNSSKIGSESLSLGKRTNQVENPAENSLKNSGNFPSGAG
jgi:hypothetical protein